MFAMGQEKEGLALTWKKDTLRGDLELCGLVVGICGYLWDPLEKEMATHSSILAWRIPQTEEPGRLQSMGPQTVEHNWATVNIQQREGDLRLISTAWCYLNSTRTGREKVRCKMEMFWHLWSGSSCYGNPPGRCIGDSLSPKFKGHAFELGVGWGRGWTGILAS